MCFRKLTSQSVSCDKIQMNTFNKKMYAQVCVVSCTQVDWRSPGSVGDIPGAVKRSSWYTDCPPSRSHSPSCLQLPAESCSHFLQKRGSANSLVEAVSNNIIQFTLQALAGLPACTVHPLQMAQIAKHHVFNQTKGELALYSMQLKAFCHFCQVDVKVNVRLDLTPQWEFLILLKCSFRHMMFYLILILLEACKMFQISKIVAH